LFDILAQKNKAMGSLILSKNGKVLYSKAIGYSFISDVEKKPAYETTKYRIGSITKMFTAAMILQLSEEGRSHLMLLWTNISQHFQTRQKLQSGIC
jgi:CubicO group peptidase (beta-lactamase class C family)